MHPSAATTIGGSPSTSINVSHHHYPPNQHQTHQAQYGQVSQPIASSAQPIQQSHLHLQHHNNHHQLVFGPLPQTTYESATAPTANQLEPQQHHHSQHPPAHQQQQPISVDTSSVISNHQALSPIHQQQPQHYGQQHSHYNQQSLNHHHHHHTQQPNTLTNHNPSLDYNQHSQDRPANNYNQLPPNLQSPQDTRQDQRHTRDNRYQGGHNPQNPGSIRWTAAGISTSAERRLPFVHRFRPVGQVGSAANNQDSHGRTGNLDARHQHPQGVGNPHHSHNQNYNSHGPLSQDARVAGHLGQRSTYNTYRRQDNFHDPHQRDLSQAEKDKRNKDKMAQYETNPVGSLQERFQSRGIPPNYKVVQTEGASHCPTFTFQVYIGDMMAVGVGNSKKQAKHAAARNMLDKLDGREPSQPTTPGQTILGSGGPTGTIISTTGENGIQIKPEDLMKEGNGCIMGGQENAGNTIGQLQEHCVRHGLPMPTYDLASVGGQPHQRSFAINCRVGCLSISGEGTSKKDAKREAATKMWQRLKILGNNALQLVTGSENGSGVSHPVESGISAGNVIGVTGEKGLDKELVELVNDNMKIDTLTPKHSKAIQQFYKGLKGTKGSRLHALHSTSIKGNSSDFVKMLADLGQEQQFEVTYVDVDEKTDSGEVQCLVQLSTLPVAVCYGVGNDVETANNDAARNALNYLKMMTKTNSTTTESTAAAKQVKNGEKSSSSAPSEEIKKEAAEADGTKKDEKQTKTSKKGKDQKNGK